MRHFRSCLCCACPSLLLMLVVVSMSAAEPTVPQRGAARVSRSLLPLCFEQESGEGRTGLYARGLDYLFRVEPSGATLLLWEEIADTPETARTMHFD